MKRILSFIATFIMLLACVVSLDCGPAPQTSFHYINSPAIAYPYKTINIWVDKNFGEADRISIDDAITQWNYALNGSIKLRVISYDFDMEPSILNDVVVKGEGWLFLKIDHRSNLYHDAPDGHVLAFVNDIGGNRIYFIRDRMINEYMRGVAMHEIGHLLGARHDKVYLMQPYYKFEYYRCIDQETVHMVAEYEHLSESHLNYCVYGNN